MKLFIEIEPVRADKDVNMPGAEPPILDHASIRPGSCGVSAGQRDNAAQTKAGRQLPLPNTNDHAVWPMPENQHTQRKSCKCKNVTLGIHSEQDAPKAALQRIHIRTFSKRAGHSTDCLPPSAAMDLQAAGLLPLVKNGNMVSTMTPVHLP